MCTWVYNTNTFTAWSASCLTLKWERERERERERVNSSSSLVLSPDNFGQSLVYKEVNSLIHNLVQIYRIFMSTIKVTTVSRIIVGFSIYEYNKGVLQFLI